MTDFFSESSLKRLRGESLPLTNKAINHHTYGNKDDVKGLTFRLKMAIFVEPLILLEMAIQQL